MVEEGFLQRGIYYFLIEEFRNRFMYLENSTHRL